MRRADAGPTRQHGGQGLGLAIVKQLVELHEGAVRDDSGGEGGGGTFTVMLPCEGLPISTRGPALVELSPPFSPPPMPSAAKRWIWPSK